MDRERGREKKLTADDIDSIFIRISRHDTDVFVTNLIIILFISLRPFYLVYNYFKCEYIIAWSIIHSFS